MDLSKLPRLSETDKHTPQPAPIDSTANTDSVPAGARGPIEFHSVAQPVMHIGGDAWINIAIGVITLLMYPRFLQWAASRLFGTHFNEFVMNDGITIVPYPQVPAFWEDLGPTSFGIMLIVEGLAMVFIRRAWVLWLAFGLTVLVTGYNAAYLIFTYSTRGLALVSALAVVFGVYIAMNQWKMLKFSLPERV